MKDLCIGLYTKAILPAKNGLRKALRGEKGAVGIIEIVIILAIVVSLALIFKNKIKDLFDKIFPDVGDGDFVIEEN